MLSRMEVLVPFQLLPASPGALGRLVQTLMWKLSPSTDPGKARVEFKWPSARQSLLLISR